MDDKKLYYEELEKEQFEQVNGSGGEISDQCYYLRCTRNIDDCKIKDLKPNYCFRLKLKR